jgi:hypothetical protein
MTCWRESAMVEQFGMIVFPHNSSSQGSVQYSHGRHVRRFRISSAFARTFSIVAGDATPRSDRHRSAEGLREMSHAISKHCSTTRNTRPSFAHSVRVSAWVYTGVSDREAYLLVCIRFRHGACNRSGGFGGSCHVCAKKGGAGGQAGRERDVKP